MTITRPATAAPRRPALDRPTAMRLAATEYDRVVELLRALPPEAWLTRTACTEWDVRQMAAHLLGMAEMAASIRESSRQVKVAVARGGVFIDALTALQVEERADLTPKQIVDRFTVVGPKAAKGRRRAPWFIRRRAMPQQQLVAGRDEVWTVGYLLDVILTRDPWMHRIDITRATGAELVHTPDHDGVLIDDVVREWAGRHGQPCSLVLTGPAGGSWRFGTGGPDLEAAVADFCLMLTLRRPAEGLFATEVPF
jgi:uncharacterized protein (TIGR03083 family)